MSASAMHVSTHYLVVRMFRRVVAEGGRHFGCTVFIVVCLLALLVGRANSNGVDTAGIAICCTRVVELTTISSCPYEY